MTRLLAATAVALALVTTSASAADRHVFGDEPAVSCLTAKLCVLAGTRSGHGELVKLSDGSAARYFSVSKTVLAYGVSCPSASGCVAVERPSGVGPFGLSVPAVSTKLSFLGSDGMLNQTVGLTLPAGVTLSRIWCSSLNSCELAGESAFATPEALAFGTWNGQTLQLRYMRAPSDVNLELGGISCAGGDCVLVGSVMKHGQTVGFAVTINNGKPTGDHLVAGDMLFGVSCTSASFCYAAGDDYSSQTGAIVPLSSGVAGAPISVAGPLSAIACRGDACIAGGYEINPGIDHGEIVKLSAGAVTTTKFVPASAGFDGVALAGSSFAAAGPANPFGSGVDIGSF